MYIYNDRYNNSCLYIQNTGSQTAARRKLYQALDDSLRIKGLDAKLGTQNLTSDELFTRVGKIVRPVLRKLDIPVRAIVIPISDTDTAL